MNKLSDDQKKAIIQIYDWYKSSSRTSHITMGGYAGTGKTTVIALFRRALEQKKKSKVAFLSYTGKATRVLANKLKETQSQFPDDYVGTIHSLIYKPVLDASGEVVGWTQKDDLEYDLLIIDEASMVDSMIWSHLLNYNIPIVAVGDHGQLPPISGSLNLMQNPTIKLENIHRQAEDNPIIKLSIMARNGEKIEPAKYSSLVVKIDRNADDANLEISELLENYDTDTLILCGYNSTRKKLNSHIRAQKEFYSTLPVAGDSVICLKNNSFKKIYNGMIGKVKLSDQIDDENLLLHIEFDNGDVLFKDLVDLSIFFDDSNTKNKLDKFDYGYAMTVHKAQGSQAKRVILFEERFKQMNDEDWNRWLYTGITRAEKELFIIG